MAEFGIEASTWARVVYTRTIARYVQLRALLATEITVKELSRVTYNIGKEPFRVTDNTGEKQLQGSKKNVKVAFMVSDSAAEAPFMVLDSTIKEAPMR